MVYEEYVESFEKSNFATYTYIRTDKNGTQYIDEKLKCSCCHGTGYIPHYSWHCNGVCFSCHGTGVITNHIKVLTREYGAKLQAKRAIKAQAQELERERREAERAEKALKSCMVNHNRKCETCKHRSYCTLLTEAITNFSNINKRNEFQESILKVDRTPEPEKAEILTLEGEPCTCSRWFTNNFGGLSRCITKPNGEKVYTSAVTDRGLKKLGLMKNPEVMNA